MLCNWLSVVASTTGGLMLKAYLLNNISYGERCKARGRQTPAKVVHHIKPIESAHTFADYERLAYDPQNLQALCNQCHADIHRMELGSYSKAGKLQRQSDRLQRWANDMAKRFDKGG